MSKEDTCPVKGEGMERRGINAFSARRRAALLREIYRGSLIRALGRVHQLSINKKNNKNIRRSRSMSSMTQEEEELRIRKWGVKLAADTSLALACDGSAWSHALLSKLAKPIRNKALIERIVGRKTMMKISSRRDYYHHICRHYYCRHRHHQRFVKRRGRVDQQSRICMANNSMSSSSISSTGTAASGVEESELGIELASSSSSSSSSSASAVGDDLVRVKTMQLKRLIPGGKSMSNSCLFKEAADYILSLKAQVEVMSSLASLHSSSSFANLNSRHQ